MVNPLVPWGFLNRVHGAVSITDVSALSVTVSYFGKDGTSMRLDGPVTDILPTMTDIAGGQVPCQQVALTVHMLRTQGLAASYQQHSTADTAPGEVVIILDTTAFGNFTLLNCYLVNFNEMPLNGTDVGCMVIISGYLTTNDNMWI